MTVKKNANEIYITRIYNAPVKAVWDAWTDPAQVAQWWGPRGFTLTSHSKDLRPGGFWRYTMHGPDGVDYPNKTEYFEVEEYSRLVYDHGANDEQPPMFRVTVQFTELLTELGKQTKMEMTMTFPSPEIAQTTGQFIKEAGGNSTWDRLAEYMEEQITNKNVFVINRSFNADIETMFKLWTTPEHLLQWSGPKGSAMEYLRADIREGGSSLYRMTIMDGKTEMYGRANYLQISPTHLIVYTQQFCDANENIARHPLAPTWPETMLTTVVLTPEGEEQTRITLTWEVYGEATAEEINTFSAAKASMTQGWTGSFDKLDDYITQVNKEDKNYANAAI